MSKLVMISVLIATIVAPVLISRDAVPARGLKRTVRWMMYFLAAWVFALAYLYGRLFS